MFGTGQVFTSSVGGGNALRLGALQDVSVEFSGDVKTLHGQYQFPLAVARGKSKIEGKIGSANIDANAFNTIYFGQTAGVTAGTKRQVQNESAAVPASSPYEVTAANGATFFRDLGVVDVLTGNRLKQVTASPTTGQYMVNQTTGKYTFASTDSGKAVLLNYLYTDASAGGTLEMTNQLMGITPYFELVASHIFEGKVFTLVLYKVVADKLSLPLKQDDFLIPEIGFSAQANDAGSLGFISTTSITGGGA